MALSQVVDVETNPADVAGVRIRYKLGTAEFSIAFSAMYQLLLLNPQRGCAILSGLREWEHAASPTRGRRIRPSLAAQGELGWEGCSDEDILMSICGMHPPTPASPRSASPTKPAPAKKPKPPAAPPPPPKTHATQKEPPTEAQVLRIGQHLVVGLGSPLSPWEGEGEAAATAKAARGAPLFGGG